MNRGSGSHPSYFDGSNFAYWKARMRAHLKSKGAFVWNITVDTSYAIPADPLSGANKEKYDANSKAIDVLLLGLCRSEFDRVQDLDLAHAIWTCLVSAHEGNTQVKAMLFETYRREYENFSHLQGESVDVMYQRFMALVNKMKANIVQLPYTDHDRALKLLHALDRKVWGTKVDAIIESPNYETLTLDELFSKLKATEVDIKLRAKHESSTSDPHSLALMTSPSLASTNSTHGSFALSALLSVTEDQLDGLGDDELALVTRKFMRFNDNRVRRRKNNTCFECGKPGQFVEKKNHTRDFSALGKIHAGVPVY
ncbi:unnamed protein product [Urochloa humidicola]